MANGLKGKVDEKKFQKALDFVCIDLAKKIAKDGEGATKLIEVNVKNALSREDAEKIAKSIITSNLVKCAIFGKDLNWGRIVCALARSRAEFDNEKIDIYFEKEKIVESGSKINFNDEKIKKIFDKDEIKIIIDLNLGKEKATAWGCDMSYDYVKINAEYHN
jgi:glutamate N-acetyltransferase/amino-acid N-acetyltransferase